MTTKKFDATPTAGEPINLDEISKENVQEAWKDYEAKPEYKDFNKHDLIESMQHHEEEKKSS
ncbi:NF038105 family protein [Acinetobacter pittii]|uniref:NF038105 family protein n=1 Tax=Acinetobacter pittii TaxID=48296 RepID=UPI003AF8FB3C